MTGSLNYVVGYGSLITKESRLNTGHTGKCMPVRINNYSRSWTARIKKKGKKYTAVSIYPSKHKSINAVITEIDPLELTSYDERETNYTRVRIKNTDITSYITNMTLPNAIIWAYIINPGFSKPSSCIYPILQSYIDIILTGCSRISEKFMVDFIHSTSHWVNIKDPRYNWINDRNKPYYNFKCNKLCHKNNKIDSLLKRYINPAFLKRKYLH